MAEVDPALVNAWLADALDDAGRRAIDELLGDEAARVQLVAEAQLVDDLRRAWADRHPARLADRIDHLLDHDRRSARLRTAAAIDRRLTLRRWLPWAAAAAVAVALSLAGSFLSSSDPAPASAWIASLPGTAALPADWPPSTVLQRQWRLQHQDTGATLDIAAGSRVQVSATDEVLTVAIEQGSLQASGRATSPIHLFHADARVEVGEGTCHWLAHAEPQPHGRLSCQEGRIVVVLPERRFELRAQAFVSIGPGGTVLPPPGAEPEAVAVIGLSATATVAELTELIGISEQSGIDSLVLPALPATIALHQLTDLAQSSGIDLIAVRRQSDRAALACFVPSDGRPSDERRLADGPVVFTGDHGRIAVCDEVAWLAADRWPAEADADLIALCLDQAVPSQRLARLWQRHWRERSVLGLASGYRRQPGDCGAALLAGDRLIRLDPARRHMVARYQLPLATGTLQLNDYEKAP